MILKMLTEQAKIVMQYRYVKKGILQLQLCNYCCNNCCCGSRWLLPLKNKKVRKEVSMRSKKFLVLAVLLSMIAVSGLWAQELKFDGYVNTGIGVISTDAKNADTVVKFFGADAEMNGYRLRLNGSYQNEAKNAGVKFRIQSQSRLDKGGYLSLPYAYGWAKFVQDIFYVAGGIVDDATWATGDWWLFSERIDGGLGALLKATPIKGLDLGLGAYVVNLQSGGNNNILGGEDLGGLGLYTSMINFGNITPKFEDVKYTFSAAYTMPDLVRVGATFRWANKAGYDADSADATKKYGGRDESSRLLGEVRFLKIKDLTAIVATSFDKIEDFENNGNIIFSETFAYKLDNINIGLNATEFLYSRKSAAVTDKDPGLLFNIWGSYTIDKIVPRLDLTYFTGGRSTLGGHITGNTPESTWRRRGYAAVMGTKDVDDDYSVFGIRPSVKFNLDGKTFIEVGDLINFDSSTKSGAYADSGDPAKKTKLSNVFYIDFKWSF
jgi:hypothetical protein